MMPARAQRDQQSSLHFLQNQKAFTHYKAAYRIPADSMAKWTLQERINFDYINQLQPAWVGYDSICQYCEDGIFLPVQWGKIRMYQYIERRDREWSALVMDSLMKNAAEVSEFMDKYLNFGMKQVRSLQRTSRAY